MATLLLVEDDPGIAKAVTRGLTQEGYTVAHVDHGDHALPWISQNHPDLVILDVRLPGLDGFTICKKIRESGNTLPVLMLTARDEEIDTILGLEIGADDYMVKPFSLRELQSRIKALLRRSSYSQNFSQGDSTVFGTLTFRRGTQRLYRQSASASEEIFLTPIETRILLYFLDNPNQVVTRQQIITAVWGEQIFLEDERTVDVHIRHLREKLESDPANPQFIQTVRGFGYRFTE